MSTADLAMVKLLKMDFSSVLDIGSGLGEHARVFRRLGKDVTTIDSYYDADIKSDFNIFPFRRSFSCIWASHVLEHQLNVNMFLKKCFHLLEDGGIFAVTVPPMKPNIVGGHVTVWNAGLLLYNLILAGFDCRAAAVKVYGYNISVIVRKRKADFTGLNYDRGDIEKLAQFFPLKVEHGFNGNLSSINWE